MRILVVDDEINNLDEIRSMLEKTGRAVEAVYFSNPLEALKVSQKEFFHAAFLDIQMPVMNGLELADRLKNLNPHMETVFITAYNHYAAEAFEVNAMDYLLKPIRYERFAKMLDKLLETVDTVMAKESLSTTLEGQPGFQEGLTPPEVTLRVFAFPAVRLFLGEKELKWNRHKTYELFCLLLLHQGERLHKDHLCETLWPELEHKRAMANLQVTVCRLRKDLADFQGKRMWVDYAGNGYVLHIPPGITDIEAFGETASQENALSLEKAMALYKGDLLATETWLWVEEARESFRRQYRKAALKLAASYLKDTNYHKVLELFETFVAKCTPDEDLSRAALQAAVSMKSKQLEKNTWAMIQQWYFKHLDMEVPEEVATDYQHHLKGSGKRGIRWNNDGKIKDE